MQFSCILRRCANIFSLTNISNLLFTARIFVKLLSVTINKVPMIVVRKVLSTYHPPMIIDSTLFVMVAFYIDRYILTRILVKILSSLISFKLTISIAVYKNAEFALRISITTNLYPNFNRNSYPSFDRILNWTVYINFRIR
ncbi:MAG: hypothetical protein K0R59_1233 [Sphingobacterium sp.]|jgi:hypothetical protein|nr:hypothetical protein [Sphingobacterium sp.]